MKRVKAVYIYYIAIFLICLGYFIEKPINPIKELGIYEKADQYFGITLLPALLFFIFYGLVFLNSDKKERFIFEMKLYFFFIVVIFALYTFILMNSGLDFSSIESIKEISLNEGYFKYLIEICLYKFKIGYVPTYLLWLILNLKFEFRYIFITLVATQIVLTIYIIYSPIKNYIKNSYIEYKERKRLEEEEKLLNEQIRIKEALEKRETMKRIKFRENKEKALEEKVEIFRKNFQLKKTIDLSDTGEDK